MKQTDYLSNFGGPMDKTEGTWNALTNFFIKNSVAIFVVATASCLILITYLTNHLKLYVIGAWVVVGILTSLMFSGVALVVVLAVAAVEKARHLRVITYEPPASNKLKDSFERERVKIVDFYSPFFVINDNKRFDNCEILGPGSILLLGSSSLNGCIFKMCDFIVVKETDKVNTAAHFNDATFTECKFFNVSIYLTERMVEKLLESHQDSLDAGLPIIGYTK